MTWQQMTSRIWKRYLIAILIVAAASAIREMLFESFGRGTAYLTYYPAILIASVFGGLIAGLLATALSAVFSYFWILKGFQSLTEELGMGFFIINCLMICSIAEFMRRSNVRAKELQLKAEASEKAKSSFLLELERLNIELKKKTMDMEDAQRLSGIGSWMYDPVIKQLEWSDEMFDIWRLDPALGPPDFRDLQKYIHSEDFPRFDEAVKEAVEHGKPYNIELGISRPDGVEKMISAICEPQYDAAGKLMGLRGTNQDITERKQAEEEINRNYNTQVVINSLLRLSLERIPLEDILSRALELILSIPWLVSQSRGSIFLIENDPELLILKAQRNLDERIQKVCALLPIGKCLCGRAALTQNIVFADSIDERHEISYDGIYPHGHYCVPIIFAKKVLGVINVYVNSGHKRNEREEELLITIANTLAGIIVRRQAEDSLVESEQKLQAITDTASDAIILIDHDEKIIYWNTSATRMLGYEPEEIMGKNIMIIMPLRYRETHARAFKKFIETGQGTLFGKTYEVFTVKKDGTEIPVELAVSGISLNGEWHAAGIIRDISERKILEGQLMQAQKMEAVGQLSGGIAHDFNNILTVIIGYGNILQIKMKEDDQLRSHVGHILEAAGRAASLTQSLLAFSRQQILNPRPHDLNEIIRRVENLLRRVIGEDIDLHTTLKHVTLTVNADSGQIEQALMNLATNARDAMPHGGSLAVETDVTELDNAFIRGYGYGEVGTYAVVSVKDTGTGMDSVTQKRIFEPFFTTKELGKGTGLGLAMVYGIVKQHHGFINVYSEPGKGTTFKIYLPLIDTKLEELKLPTNIPEDKLPHGSETVLIAEDDETLRLLFRSVLTESGYHVIEAENGIEAVIKFMNNKNMIKIVLLDIIMPKKGGKEAYEEIIKVRPDVKFLLMSGYTADIKIAEELRRKGVEFMLKPISPRDLLKRVRACLDS